HAEVERREPRPDEAHVVIERQPAHTDVAWAELDRAADPGDVGEEVRVREEHTLRLARAARRILDEGRIRRSGSSGRRPCALDRERIRRYHLAQALHPR